MLKKISTCLSIFFLIGSSSLLFCAGLNNTDPRFSLREYRKFILPNQMKVVLISDPTLQRGAASMTVAVGSMDDPSASLGLAHLLEHMLFLGTEKYPDEGSYQKFISMHDGFSNAYTTEDRTNYHFEIDSNYLEEALDRFAHFFTSPLFNQQLLEREINIVDEEHSKNIFSDYSRIFQIQKKAYANGHPARHFATGNLETLKNVTRENLISFYKNNYSSNKMFLAVAGPQNMDYLQELVVARFNKIKNYKLSEKIVSSKFMEKDQRFRLLQIKTIKDLRKLKLIFPLAKTLHHYKSRPLGMLGFLVGHEGSGSLLSLLKMKNLASNLSAGGGISNKSFSSFDVDIQLTEKGIKNYNKVIEYFFQYINLIRRTGLPKYVFDEVKLMSEIEYRFAEKKGGVSLVNTFSTLMMYYPMRNMEVSPYLIKEYNPRLFDSILYNLIPENMLAILASKNAKVNKTEKFFSAEYSYTYSNPRWIKKWRQIKHNSVLKLPLKNKFLPKRLEILDSQVKLLLTYQSILGLEKEGLNHRVIKHLKKYQGQTWESFDSLLKGISPLPVNEVTLKKLLRKHLIGIPEILIDNSVIKFWFQRDFRFKTPKAKLILRIHSPIVYSSPKNSVLAQLYVDSVLEGLNEFGYPVKLSGLDFRINYDKKGITLTIGGFSDRILELTKSFAVHLKTISISDKTFKRLRENRSRSYDNFNYQQPYKQALYYRKLLLENKKFSIFEYKNEIRKIEIKDLKKFVGKLYEKNYIEGFAYGNLEPNNVKKTLEEFTIKLVGSPLKKTKQFINSVRQISNGNTHTFLREMLEDNTAVLMEYQIGQRNPKLLALVMIIERLLEAEFYNNLRTKQQLGYIVDSSMTMLENTMGLMFLIQSNEKDSETLVQRMNNFLGNFYFILKNLTSSEIYQIKKSILNKKLTKTTSFDSEARRLFNIIFKKNAKFDMKSQEIKALEKITHKDIVEFYGKHLLPSIQKKLILKMISNNTVSRNNLDKNVISLVNFREKYDCPRKCLP